MNPEDTQKYIEMGKNAFSIGKHSVDEFRKITKSKTFDCGNDTPWHWFVNGWNESHEGVKIQQRKNDKVDEFMAELRVLCKKYNARISSGCGCCGAGIYVNDNDYGMTDNNE